MSLNRAHQRNIIHRRLQKRARMKVKRQRCSRRRAPCCVSATAMLSFNRENVRFVPQPITPLNRMRSWNASCLEGAKEIAHIIAGGDFQNEGKNADGRGTRSNCFAAAQGNRNILTHWRIDENKHKM
jgi:hypothetical protein